MGLILCEKYDVKHPLYVNILGIRIYSLEELCYIIYEYPLLVIDDFVGDKLFSFLLDDLNLGMSAVHMKKKKADGYHDEDILIDILSYSDYYTPAEVDKYKLKLASYRQLERHEYLKQKADFMFSIQKYSNAVRFYESALAECPKNDTFKASIESNIGCCFANMFNYDKAFDSFVESYKTEKNANAVKNIYYLSIVEPVIEKKQQYMAYVEDKVNAQWDSDYNKAVADAHNSEEISKLNEVFNKDSVKRNREITKIFNTWKQDYRNMA